MKLFFWEGSKAKPIQVPISCRSHRSSYLIEKSYTDFITYVSEERNSCTEASETNLDLVFDLVHGIQYLESAYSLAGEWFLVFGFWYEH